MLVSVPPIASMPPRPAAMTTSVTETNTFTLLSVLGAATAWSAAIAGRVYRVRSGGEAFWEVLRDSPCHRGSARPSEAAMCGRNPAMGDPPVAGPASRIIGGRRLRVKRATGSATWRLGRARARLTRATGRPPARRPGRVRINRVAGPPQRRVEARRRARQGHRRGRVVGAGLRNVARGRPRQGRRDPHLVLGNPRPAVMVGSGGELFDDLRSTACDEFGSWLVAGLPAPTPSLSRPTPPPRAGAANTAHAVCIQASSPASRANMT